MSAHRQHVLTSHRSGYHAWWCWGPSATTGESRSPGHAAHIVRRSVKKSGPVLGPGPEPSGDCFSVSRWAVLFPGRARGPPDNSPLPFQASSYNALRAARATTAEPVGHRGSAPAGHEPLIAGSSASPGVGVASCVGGCRLGVVRCPMAKLRPAGGFRSRGRDELRSPDEPAQRLRTPRACRHEVQLDEVLPRAQRAPGRGSGTTARRVEVGQFS